MNSDSQRPIIHRPQPCLQREYLSTGLQTLPSLKLEISFSNIQGQVAYIDDQAVGVPKFPIGHGAPNCRQDTELTA